MAINKEILELFKNTAIQASGINNKASVMGKAAKAQLENIIKSYTVDIAEYAIKGFELNQEFESMEETLIRYFKHIKNLEQIVVNLGGTIPDLPLTLYEVVEDANLEGLLPEIEEEAKKAVIEGEKKRAKKDN